MRTGLARVAWAVALLGACGDDGSNGPQWTAVSEDMPAALLSVWSSSASDVWVVGGDPRDGTGPIVEHYDGAAWTKLDTGQRNVDLWWVTGFAGGPIFMSGSNGTILRYQNGAFEKLTTPGASIVFGMWGASPTDVWAVGGNLGGGSGGFAWRFDGNAWTMFADVPTDLKTQGTCFKVNGRSASDVWIAGTSGTTLHWNGTAIERVAVPVDASLFSVAGNAVRFVTVGGGTDGVLFENDGSGWRSAVPTGGSRLTGVAVSEDDAYAVGQFGTILRRGKSGWSVEKPHVTNENLHAAWIDPTGGAWAVGGDFDRSPTTAGVLLHKGEVVQGLK